ncbi:hypothetical protein [Acinetobacter indicus]|uniref:hypothetical protein n=1 Tax=Acinetobacter indicus TaxID=756892 RepID=UPI000948B436|nr:hypothetical protein [Acinetobacter indicus]
MKTAVPHRAAFFMPEIRARLRSFFASCHWSAGSTTGLIASVQIFYNYKWLKNKHKYRASEKIKNEFKHRFYFEFKSEYAV